MVQRNFARLHFFLPIIGYVADQLKIKAVISLVERSAGDKNFDSLARTLVAQKGLSRWSQLNAELSK